MLLRNFESKVFFTLVLLTTAIFLWMVRGFLLPVFWAAVLAILFQRAFLWLTGIFGGRRAIAAIVSTVLVIVIVLIPAGLIAAALAQQALSLYQQITSGQIDVAAGISWLERMLPRLTELLAEYGIEIGRIRETLESAAVVATQWVASQALSAGQNIASALVMFALMLYLLFFFFRDGDDMVRGAVRAIPMGDERERQLFHKFAQVTRATVKGTLVVAAVQGTIGGILFALLGLQAAVFWGVVMAVLSLLPAIGPALVWLPASVVLFSTGRIWEAVVMILGGVFVIGLVDNLLRPILVGRETKMPDYLVLLSTLGGLSMFGLAGFVVGPIIASLFLVMWEMFADEYSPLDSSATPAVAAVVPVPVPSEPIDQHQPPDGSAEEDGPP